MPNWRMKVTLVEQLSKLSEHLPPELISEQIIPLFLPILTDKMFCVRTSVCSLSGDMAYWYVCGGDVEAANKFVMMCKDRIYKSKMVAFQAHLTYEPKKKNGKGGGRENMVLSLCVLY
eukprot:m.78581 g.78581  ORF g.78581 m.78581 type:complete len:118 (-) comp11959_c1_seq5:655-1008(-)